MDYVTVGLRFLIVIAVFLLTLMDGFGMFYVELFVYFTKWMFEKCFLMYIWGWKHGESAIKWVRKLF